MGAALIPAAKIGGGMLMSWLGNKMAKKGTDPTKVASATPVSYDRGTENQTAYNSMTGAADTLSAAGKPLMEGAGGYYGALLRGSRSAMSAAIAPERQAITDTYRGAEAGAKRLRGPARDKALMELSRQRTAQTANLPFAARTNAAGQAAQLGLGASTAGASIYERALGSGDTRDANRLKDVRAQDELRLKADERQSQAGSDWGDLFGAVLDGVSGHFGKPKLPTAQVNGWSMSPYAAAVQPRRP